MVPPAVFQLTDTDEYIAAGRDQWMYWFLPRFHDVRIHVCENAAGRLLINSLVVESRDRAGSKTRDACVAIEPSQIRELTLGRLETAINSPAIAQALRLPRTELPPLHPGTTLPTLEDMQAVARQISTGLKLDVPATYQKADDFYAQVARAFESASQGSAHPAIDIAEANGVPKTTVHRWVREARRRGVMAAAPQKTRETN